MPKADLSAYTGREQAYVKHYLLEKCLAPLAYKVGSAWDSFVYVDGFSGPWKTTRADYADSSFAVAIDVLREVRRINGEPKIAVIMFSALSDPMIRNQALELGASEYWVKASMDVQEIMGRLKKFLPAPA